MNKEIESYNDHQTKEDKAICDLLAKEISAGLPNAESKVWHGHPVWFLEGNPIAGYSKEKQGLRLMFWSGADFKHEGLKPGTGKFKDASVFYQSVEDVNVEDLREWLKESQRIQWDYKNIIKNKGLLKKI